MKEMIERLIADGWEWVACDKDEMINIYINKPELNIREDFCGYRKHHVPSCLFPEITFENSPVELKTLLVDDEEEKSQIFIRECLEEDKNCYLLKEYGSLPKVYLTNNATRTIDAQPLIERWNYIKNIVVHEKVYLKDLVKKRKVKKSVWLVLNEDKDILCSKEKPFIFEHRWTSHSGFVGWFRSNGFDGIKEDEPIELFYEVEE